jgi:hypothetical protein
LGRGKRYFRVDVKAFPVVFTQAVFFDGVAMFPGAISFITIPAIVGEFGMKPAHVFIAPGLGKDACCGNRGENGISLHDTTMRGTPVADETITVDEQELRSEFELIEGEVHGFERSFQDIDAVDLGLVYEGHSPCEGVGFDVRSQQVAVLFSDLLGVIEEWMEKRRGKDNSRCEYRACIATSPGFITAGFPEIFLVVASQRVFHAER